MTRLAPATAGDSRARERGGGRERLLAPLLRPLLRRDPGEIARRAARFAIRSDDGRRLVARLGEAFVGGFNAMLDLDDLAAVRAAGERVESHFRPFFFEGAAMGYLPRGYLVRGGAPARAEADLMAMHPGFQYLYYVGLGFWFALRHPWRAAALETLRPHVDPMYLPLCYDGLGFKIGFFDYPKSRRSRRRLDRCPEAHRAAAYQGFGRSLFFVFMDDEPEFRRERDLDPARSDDIECGRSLALAFTGADRPASLVDHLKGARDQNDLGARLTGITWALTARDMNEPDYLRRCLAPAPPRWRDLLLRLPGLCRTALSESHGYAEWQARSRRAALSAFVAAEPG